jgi:hypothetical protein
LLSRSGYVVEDRPVSVPANREALIELGYLSVPVVEVAGRAFPGFPLRSLTVNLGLARARFSPKATLRTLASSLDALEGVAALLPELPPEMWSEQAYPLQAGRDHTFGHFLWGVFRFLELTLQAPERGGLPWEELQESVQVSDWRSAAHYRSFADVSEFAQPLLARGREWHGRLAPEEMRAPLTTPWGPLELHVLVGILAEHTDIKRTHLLKRLGRV